MNTAAEQIRSLLRSLHHVQLNQLDDFQIQNQKTLLDTQMAAASRLGFFLRWIAASALTVSGLGIVAITWIALKERTREIGTRRALGTTRNDIFLQVLVETTTLAATGSLLGAAVSWPTSHLISQSVGLPFMFQGSTATFAFAVAVTLNLAFSVLPSRKAASVSPLEALMYELRMALRDQSRFWVSRRQPFCWDHFRVTVIRALCLRLRWPARLSSAFGVPLPMPLSA